MKLISEVIILMIFEYDFLNMNAPWCPAGFEVLQPGDLKTPFDLLLEYSIRYNIHQSFFRNNLCSAPEVCEQWENRLRQRPQVNHYQRETFSFKINIFLLPFSHCFVVYLTFVGIWFCWFCNRTKFKICSLNQDSTKRYPIPLYLTFIMFLCLYFISSTFITSLCHRPEGTTYLPKNQPKIVPVEKNFIPIGKIHLTLTLTGEGTFKILEIPNRFLNCK